MFDLLIKNANLPDDRKNFDVAIQNKKIVAVDKSIDGDASHTIDATDQLVSPSHVDSHFHLDATLTLGQPRLMRVEHYSREFSYGMSSSLI